MRAKVAAMWGLTTVYLVLFWVITDKVWSAACMIIAMVFLVGGIILGDVE